MEVVGRKGRETSPSEPIRGTEWSHSLRGRCGGRGRVRCLVRKVPYQAKRVQRTKEKKKNTNSEKGSGGMVEVGPNNRGASPPKPMLGSQSSQPGKTK